ncbi:MAG: cobalamin-dependent protein [Pseudomonadota bacterium]
MASRYGDKTTMADGVRLVDHLALSVISKVNDGPGRHRNRRLEVGTRILLTAILEDSVFDQEQMKHDLEAFRISPADIIDYCIPYAAEKLGEDWVNDRLSFAKVTICSARLYGLCKLVGREWDGVRAHPTALNIVIATIRREDHIIGPAVLTEKLRRRGHSVRILHNTTASEIAKVLSEDHFDGVFITASSLTTLDYAKKAINTLRKQNVAEPLILGGAALNATEDRLKDTGADLVTNDIDTAIDALTASDSSLKVAE